MLETKKQYIWALKKRMKISIIISFYKNLAALDLIFKALAKQSYKNFEVNDNSGGA